MKISPDDHAGSSATGMPGGKQFAVALMNVMLVVGFWAVTSCAPLQSGSQLALVPGARWQEIAKAGGSATVTFSYRMDGRKYDVVTFENTQSPIVFEDSRLYAILPAAAVREFDRRLTTCLQREGLPLEQGLGPIHSWVREQHRGLTRHAPPSPPAASLTAGDVAESATALVILAPISPILLAGGVCAASEYAMTGADRKRAQSVNDALLRSGVGYREFLAQLPKPVLQIAKGGYQVHEYLATPGAFFSWNKYFYDVGIHDGRVTWVAYQSDSLRSKTYQYWKAHRAP